MHAVLKLIEPFTQERFNKNAYNLKRALKYLAAHG